jgi:hypothetical protein
VLEWGRHRGTFLPQVWAALPDTRDFLCQLKLKAGLPHDFWSNEIRFYRYQAAKWREPEPAQTAQRCLNTPEADSRTAANSANFDSLSKNNPRCPLSPAQSVWTIAARSSAGRHSCRSGKAHPISGKPEIGAGVA